VGRIVGPSGPAAKSTRRTCSTSGAPCDDALPLILANIEGVSLVRDGRLTQAEAMLPRIEDAVVEHWDDPAKCDGRRALNLADGSRVAMLGFMERAYQMARGTA